MVFCKLTTRVDMGMTWLETAFLMLLPCRMREAEASILTGPQGQAQAVAGTQ